jgi:uncharacterized membrane protein YkvI
MFVIVFGAIHLGFIELITNRYMPYISFGLLFLVIVLAIFLVGTPKIKIDELTDKENKNDKK